ncbi:MAG: Histone deacetylase hda1 [Geoglossum simile]|nr:MAG: Histone deacetylase hda1 [Geoglossum simile]
MSLVNVDTDVVMEDAIHTEVAQGQHAVSAETTPGQEHSTGIIGTPIALAAPLVYRQGEAMDETDDIVISEVQPSPKSTPANPPTRTGLCYDVRMRRHATIDSNDVHPEDPRRIAVIYDALVRAGLVDKSEAEGRDWEKSHFLYTIPARKARRDEVTLIHTDELYDFIQGTELMSNSRLLELSQEGDSIYFSQSSFLCAILSCGGAIETCMAVMGSKVKNAIAVIRPPGHHAERRHPQGFCLFNNACVATQVVRKSYPKACRKILIMDWDVHHGNGTQNAFYDDPNVLYISIHVHKDGKFYPLGGAGGYDRCGAETGLGKNVNIPWPKHGMGDGDYIYAFQHVVMPIAYEFDPDLVIISAGFDAAEGDEIGQCKVTPACYAHMTHMLMSLAGGKVVALLEGGYNLDSIAKSALAVARTLMGEPPERKITSVPSKAGYDTVQIVVRQQARYWDSLGDRHLQIRNKAKAERMHDVIRAYQGEKLFSKFKMTKLHILRDRISRSYDNQVLATSGHWEAKTIVIIVHDPQVILYPFLRSSLIDNFTDRILLVFLIQLQKGLNFMKHGLMYIRWATEKSYAVIDVNIPQFLTGVEDSDSDVSKGKAQSRRSKSTSGSDQLKDPVELQKQAIEVMKSSEEVCLYLWDNYLEVSTAKNFILLGVGQAYLGILHLLNNRECFDRVKAIVQFIGDIPIKPVRGTADTSQWYYSNSYNLVTPKHPVWETYSIKKPKKKFGQLVKANSEWVNDMLRDHRSEVIRWIGEQLGESPSPVSTEEIDVAKSV